MLVWRAIDRGKCPSNVTCAMRSVSRHGGESRMSSVRVTVESDFPIIDSHQHLTEKGRGDRTFGWSDNTVDVILRAMDQSGVSASIVQPAGGCPDPLALHRDIAEYCRRYRGRIYGIASLNAKEHGAEKTRDEFRRCVRDHGFVGIKFHGFSHGLDPLSDLGRLYFETGLELQVPVVVCVGAHGLPFTSPGLYAQIADEYPGLDIVFAHLDYPTAQHSTYLASRYRGIYLTSSLSITHYLRDAILTAGAHKVMLGSEDSASIPSEIAKVAATGVSDEALRQVLRETAIKVFKLAA